MQDKTEKVAEILAKVKTLQPLSRSAAELIAMADTEEVSASEIASIVSKDPALAGEILRTANSAMFNPTKPILSIQHAVTFMGLRNALGIAIKFCMSFVFDKPLSGYESEDNALWNYSLATAVASRVISRYAKQEISGELAYTAGLLHSIGKFILSEYLKVNSAVLDKLINADGKDFSDLERAIIGIDHCQVGAELAKHWQLPEEICQVIANYNNPSSADEEHKSLAYIVHTACFVAMSAGFSTGADALQYNLDSDYEEYLNLNTDSDLELIIVEVLSEMARLNTPKGE